MGIVVQGPAEAMETEAGDVCIMRLDHKLGPHSHVIRIAHCRDEKAWVFDLTMAEARELVESLQRVMERKL